MSKSSNNPTELINDLLTSKANYELRKKEEQLAAAILRVSVLKKKIAIIKKRNKKFFQEINR